MPGMVVMVAPAVSIRHKPSENPSISFFLGSPSSWDFHVVLGLPFTLTFSRDRYRAQVDSVIKNLV